MWTCYWHLSQLEFLNYCVKEYLLNQLGEFFPEVTTAALTNVFNSAYLNMQVKR